LSVKIQRVARQLASAVCSLLPFSERSGTPDELTEMAEDG
jgi:hypothetical protein